MTVAVHDLGGDGPPVVLAHATGFHGMVWEPLAAALVDTCHCAAFDHRAHGDSDVPGGDLHWAGLGDDVLAVVDGLALDRPAAVGHSAGGTALLLAEAARPGTFRSLYCYEPIVVPADPPLGRDPDNWLAAAARRRREVFRSRDEAYAAYAAKPPLASLAPAALRAYVEHGFEDLDDGWVRLKCRAENEAALFELASAHDAYARLPSVGCPTLLAGGANADAGGPGALAVLAARLPTARVEVLAGLGHLGPLEDPAGMAASVRRWLQVQSG